MIQGKENHIAIFRGKDDVELSTSCRQLAKGWGQIATPLSIKIGV